MSTESASSLGLLDLVKEINSRVSFVSIDEPPKRNAGIKVASVDELIEKLRSETGVL